MNWIVLHLNEFYEEKCIFLWCNRLDGGSIWVFPSLFVLGWLIPNVNGFIPWIQTLWQEEELRENILYFSSLEKKWKKSNRWFCILWILRTFTCFSIEGCGQITLLQIFRTLKVSPNNFWKKLRFEITLLFALSMLI